MTKIVYPEENEVLVCEYCNGPLEVDYDFDEDGDIDFYWCEFCMDYVDGTCGE